jgi:hypothetical protein
MGDKGKKEDKGKKPAEETGSYGRGTPRKGRSTIDRFDPGTGPDGLWAPGTKKRRRVRSEYYDYELIDLNGDEPITVWRGIVRTLITMFEARTGGSSAAGGSSAGV